MRNAGFGEVMRASPFVRNSLAAMFPGMDDAGLAAKLSEIAADSRLEDAARAAVEAASDDEEGLALAMRGARRRTLVALAARDATGLCGYPEVVRVMTALAETCVQAAVAFQVKALAKRFGVPMSEDGVPQDLLVVGMGKLGGCELNVSSDIDLIFLYDRSGETRATPEFPARRTLTNREFFERVARRVIPMLSDFRGCGFVFRVDMRLRPDGDAGPIACSSGMLEEYLFTQGRDWERFAWLKGRIISAPVLAAREQFEAQKTAVESLVRPFVYRKYVDFSAVSSLSELHDMIRAEAVRREARHMGEGANVKLGTGGIREIEFIAQTFQVIRGGRDAALRSRSTLKTLDHLGRSGILTADEAEKLRGGYVFLRNLEHAIQYVNDQQTQIWPSDPEARSRVATLFGDDPEAVDAKLSEVRNCVQALFDSIFHAGGERKGDGWPAGWNSGAPGMEKAIESKVRELGYGDAESVSLRVAALIGTKNLARSKGALERMSSVIVTVFEHCAEWAGTTPRDEELDRCLGLLEVIAGRPTYVALLYQYPEMLKKVGRVLASGRWAAKYIIEHPIILDDLLDHRVEELGNDSPVDWSSWRAGLERSLEDASDDRETQLNLIRDAHHGAVFRLLRADLDGALSTERLADHLSALADAAVEVTLNLAWESMPRKFEGPPRFAVMAYGKLGGKELDYVSDLDLIYLYDDDRPDADVVYTRLVRRLMNWLTMQTSSGRLFDVDLRLRPNGRDGLVVSTYEAWQRYERNEDGKGAWTWELQALSRGRFCAGDRTIGEKFEAERRRIMLTPRDRMALAREIAEMRERSYEGHENRTALFDVKQDKGGMVDIEFVVQYLVLAWSCEHPELVGNLGNINLLRMAGEAGLVDKALAGECLRAYRRYRAMQREVRLAEGDGPVRVSPAAVEAERASVARLWDEVVAKAARGPEAP